jgi:hypothetical protein
MSIVPPSSHDVISQISIHCFSGFAIIYSFSIDTMMGIVWKPIAFPSKLLTWVMTVLCLGNMIIRYWIDFDKEEHQNIAWSVASAFAVLGILAVDLKLAMAGSQYPKHVVRMTKQNPYK